MAAMWTSTHHKPIGQKLFGFLIVQLLCGLFNKIALIIKCFKKITCSLMMNRIGSPSIMIKRNPKIIKRRLNHIVIMIDDFFRCLPLFFGSNRNCNTMLIASTNKKNIFSFHSQIASINICWHINTSQMPNMNWTIGIGKCCCNGVALLWHVVV